MHGFQNDTTPVARKAHKCAECGLDIPKGVKHHLQKGTYDGSFYTWRVHADCAELYWRLNRDLGVSAYWDEALPISEFCITEIDYLRGYFPHAVCRQILARDLSNMRYEKRRQIEAI